MTLANKYDFFFEIKSEKHWIDLVLLMGLFVFLWMQYQENNLKLHSIIGPLIGVGVVYILNARSPKHIHIDTISKVMVVKKRLPYWESEEIIDIRVLMSVALNISKGNYKKYTIHLSFPASKKKSIIFTPNVQRTGLFGLPKSTLPAGVEDMVSVLKKLATE